MERIKTKEYEGFSAILRKAGFRVTPIRIAVLSTLYRTRKPISPQEVIGRLGKKADQATIYRILKSLKRTGSIRQVDFRHNHPHYELADTKDHHHIICVSCGFSEEITGCDIHLIQNTVLRQTKNFAAVTEHSLEFYGMCTACKNKLGGSKRAVNADVEQNEEHGNG